MTPQLKVQDGKLIVDGKFDFEFGKPVYDTSDYIPTIDITFKWCPEIPLNAQLLIKDNQHIEIELIAEKLKQDFIENLYKIGNKEPTPTKMLWEGENPNSSYTKPKYMKYLSLTILNILWLLTTLVLTISVIGILVFFIDNEQDEPYWFNYGKKLLDGFSK